MGVAWLRLSISPRPRNKTNESSAPCEKKDDAVIWQGDGRRTERRPCWEGRDRETGDTYDGNQKHFMKKHAGGALFQCSFSFFFSFLLCRPTVCTTWLLLHLLPPFHPSPHPNLVSPNTHVQSDLRSPLPLPPFPLPLHYSSSAAAAIKSHPIPSHHIAPPPSPSLAPAQLQHHVDGSPRHHAVKGQRLVVRPVVWDGEWVR